jgi:hypothetical protein
MDEVGGRLSLPPGAEQSTLECRLRSHLNYWDDPLVHRYVRVCRRSSRRIATLSNNENVDIAVRKSLPIEARRSISNIRQFNFRQIRLLLILLPAVLGNRVFLQSLSDVELHKQMLEKEGQSVHGELFQLENFSPGSKDSPPMSMFEYAVEFTVQGKRYSLRTDGLLVHNRTLSDRFHSPTRKSAFPLTPFIPTYVVAAEIIFLRSDPTIFTIRGAECGPGQGAFWLLAFFNAFNLSIVGGIVIREVVDILLAGNMSTILGIRPAVTRRSKIIYGPKWAEKYREGDDYMTMYGVLSIGAFLIWLAAIS